MRRYDALSHNSYLNLMLPQSDIQDGATNAPRACSRKNGMRWQLQTSPCFLGG